MLREITDRESRMIGFVLDDPFLTSGHPVTCNGGNNNLSTHHDHEVRMLIENFGPENLNIRLVCPECDRVQEISLEIH